MALPILDGNQTATTLSTILTGGQHIPAHTVVSLGSQAITDMRSAVSGSVVSISNFPATQVISGTVTATPTGTQTIAGTVTANVGLNVAQSTVVGSSDTQPPAAVNIGWRSEEQFHGVGVDAGGLPLPARIYLGGNSGTEVSTGNPLPISGTVTANLGASSTNPLPVIQWNDTNQLMGFDVPFGIGGAVTIGGNRELIFLNVTSQGSPIITGTVTANNPSGALTTRFGSVTTANTAQLTSAVTNTSRKYLLVQNIATSTVTIGIGFAPTTTQGIQLTAGAGLTFDAFCPTGGVWWLSSTTGSNFSILEG